MTIKAATPYLILHGKAREAIALYEHALGAKTQSVQRFGDVDQSCAEALRDSVMHAELRLDEAVLLLSDGGEAPAGAATSGGDAKVSVAIQADDETAARRSFELLGEGGVVIQPLFAAPWGGLFGVVVDRFGISWMFNVTPK